MKIKDFKNIIEELKNSVNDISESTQKFWWIRTKKIKKKNWIYLKLMMKKKIFKTVKETNEAIKEAQKAMKIEDFEN